MNKYCGYISAIKDGDAETRPIFVEAECPGTAFSSLIDAAYTAFPEKEGYSSHATSTEEGLVLVETEERDRA
jgi:hypothetical protein